MGISPLAARQSAIPYFVILIAIVAIAIMLVVWILLLLLKKYKNSPEYIKAKKNRATTLPDVQALAKKINLTRPEASLLFKICNTSKIRNIYYSWSNPEEIDNLFKREFERMKKEGGGTEEEMLAFFQLRTHLDKILSVKRTISSSHNIPVGENLIFENPLGVQYNFKILKNEKDDLTLSVPNDFENSEFCPKPLEKFEMKYFSRQNNKYSLETRLIRFQSGNNNTREMVVQHMTAVSMQNLREYKRANVGVDCFFSAVKEEKDKNGETRYKPKENKYRGWLVDISASGCMIITKLPITRNQKIWMEMKLSGYEKIECCGLIVGVDKKKGMHSMHISFLDISGKQRNEIFSYVYNYA